MYDRAETRAANDRLWKALQAALRLTKTSALLRDEDPWAHWTSDSLVFSQTCGYPYRAKLHDKVQLIATPDYDLGCAPGHYFSVFVVRKDDPRSDLVDFEDAVFGYNDAMSQSGWAAPQTTAKSHGFQFKRVSETGSHIGSAKAVADGTVDIAALDALSWDMMREWDGFAANLRVLAKTAETPTLPFITSLTQDAEVLRAALEAAVSQMSVKDRAILRLTGIVQIPSSAYLAVPTPDCPKET